MFRLVVVVIVVVAAELAGIGWSGLAEVAGVVDAADVAVVAVEVGTPVAAVAGDDVVVVVVAVVAVVDSAAGGMLVVVVWAFMEGYLVAAAVCTRFVGVGWAVCTDVAVGRIHAGLVVGVVACAAAGVAVGGSLWSFPG